MENGNLPIVELLGCDLFLNMPHDELCFFIGAAWAHILRLKVVFAPFFMLFTADLQGFDFPFFIVDDDGVAEPDNIRVRPIVNVERDCLRLWIFQMEIQYKRMLRAVERIDCLIIIPDDHQIAVACNDHAKQHILQMIRILEFIGHHILEAPLQGGEERGILKQQLMSEDEDIIEVHLMGLFFPGLIPKHRCL
ncbi:hypothetical protein D3C78_1346660 [compost metagenome]